MPSYVDLSTLHSPVGGQRPPAEWGRQVRDNFELVAKPPRCGLKRTASQTITSGAWAAVEWDSEDYDTASLHSVVTNTSRVTIPTGSAGVWSFKTAIEFTANGGGTLRGVGFRKNDTGTNPPTHGRAVFPPHAGEICIPLAGDILVSEGDWVDVVVYHNVGSDLDLAVVQGVPFFTAHLVAVA